MAKKRPTIQDVALLAGVSRSAVSKVMRNAYGISDQMRANVEAAMDALQYRPQTAARGLRGRTYTIGVVMPNIRNPFFPDIVDGIWSALAGTPYQPVFAVKHSEDETEESMIEMMFDRKLDGFIMISPYVNRDYLRKLAVSFPAVIIGRHEDNAGFDTVNNDDQLGGYLVTKHLIEQQHKSIAFFGFKPVDDTAVNPVIFRLRGYLAAMQEHGLDSYIQICNGNTGFSPLDDRPLVYEVLAGEKRPSAIFAWSDQIAMTILSVADELGLRIPEDLAIVGYDNTWACSLSQLRLSSMDQDPHRMGTTSVRLLIERIEGRTESINFVTPPELIVRDSSQAGTMPSRRS